MLHEKKITPIHYETLIRIFELDGFIVKRKKGDHIIMTKVGVKGLELDMRRFLALKYFKNKRLSMGKAAKLAGMNRFDFMDFLVKEGVVLFDYDESAVKEELEGVYNKGDGSLKIRFNQRWVNQ